MDRNKYLYVVEHQVGEDSGWQVASWHLELEAALPSAERCLQVTKKVRILDLQNDTAYYLNKVEYL